MRRLVTALVVCVTVGVPLLPEIGLASGRPAFQRGFHPRTGGPPPGSFVPPPFYRPPGAFGSPGGYPLPIGERPTHPIQPIRGFRGHHAHKFPRQTFVTWYPTAFWSTPTPLYSAPAEAPSPVVTVSPVIYAAPTVYVSQPQSPAAPVPPAPPEPPPPTVVEHATGRYELRGDGVVTPYVWVWIPNPPPAPPVAAAPAPEESLARPASRSRTYRWTDGDGTLVLTNRLEEVPERYRPQASPTTQSQ